jgi:hypothetical protein
MEGGFVAETLILHDTVETGECVGAINLIAVDMFNVRDG